MNVVVTGGGTIAPIDDVRHVANASTGRFSAAITEAALARGASVWHVHAPSAHLPFARPDLVAWSDADLGRLRASWRAARDRLHLVRLARGTVDDYAVSLRRTLSERPVDVVFLAMAVSDYRPVPVAGKIASDAEELVVRLQKAPKVIRSVRDWAPGAYLVGFKLLSGAGEPALIQAAEGVCAANRVDLCVANDLQTVHEGRHTIHLVRPGAAVEQFGPPEPIAERLVDRVFALAADRP